MRNLFESAADWEYWISEDRKIILMSPSCKEITGYKQEEFYENPHLIADIVHRDDRDVYERHLDEKFMSPKHESVEFRIVTKMGEVKWISHVCGPVYLGGRFSGRRVVNRDVTYAKRLEEQLLQSQKMEAIGALTGGIAHDFNNILTAIIGYGSLMRIKMREDDPLRTYLEQILYSTKRAESLTQSLLAFSRKQIINPVPVNLNDIVKNVEKLLIRLIGEDIEFKTILADVDLPVMVADTGVGMDERTKERIFEPFFTTKEVGKGTGLGLSIVYGIIKQHNGNINVYSEPGKGTTFKIYLPLTKSEIGMKQAEVLPPLRGGTETILIAEDEADVRRLVREVMEEHGYRVIEAGDGEEALERFAENRDSIHLVLLDVIMPKKTEKRYMT